SRLIDQQQVLDLPLNGRNPAELLLLAAGVANPMMNNFSQGPGIALQFAYPSAIGGSDVQQGALIAAVNGTRSGGVYFSLDGANNVDAYAVTGGPFPNPDAVQEFRVMTSNYGAEYPSAPGGVVNIVTKSGTNTFHGNLFEFIRNGALNARNFFAAKQDNIRRNQFGFTAGGPIRKDKLFIFGSYQGTRLRSSVGGDIQFVPTDAQRAGDFSAFSIPLKNPYNQAPYPNNRIPLSDFSPVTAKILAHLPRSSAPDGRIEVVHPTSQSEEQVTVKGDYKLGKHSFVARYLFSDFTQPPVTPDNWLGVSPGPTIRWQDAMLGHNWASVREVNEFRFTFQRNAFDVISGLKGESFTKLGANVTEPQVPFIEFIQVAGQFVIPGGSRNTFPRETFTWSDRLSLIRGRHQLSMGTEISRLRNNQFTDHLQSSAAIWANLPPQAPFTSGNIIADFLLGKVTLFPASDGLLARARGTLWGFYVTDQLRVSPKLSLTLGLRWDPFWPFHTLNGRMACFNPGQKSTVFANAPVGLLSPGDPGCNESGTDPDLSTFQPRFGFAYSLDQKGNTSIRGGYGMYTMQFP
ncbi:MAG: TonB-dependent receptor, partial [Acidobacteria bacterium]|nr:TonB-dependent receptor [Acidobacteriota bacterium]